MYKYISYFWLALLLLVAQVFLLDNISIAMWLRPMLFPLIVLLLPMELRTVWVLFVALGVGLAMDLAIGGAGLYTASLLPLAMIRSTLLYATTGRYVEHSDQTALLPRLAIRQLILYIAVAMLLHHTLFFFLETLSLANLSMLIGRIVASTLLSTLIALPVTRLFVAKIATK